MQARAADLKIDTTHFKAQPGRPRKSCALVTAPPRSISASISAPQEELVTEPRPDCDKPEAGRSRRPRLAIASDERFAEIISISASWVGVLDHLGYSRRSEKVIAQARARAQDLGLSTAHFHKTWTDDELVTAVASATSWRGVARDLGLAATGGRQLRILKQRVEELRLDVSHFTGTRRWPRRQLDQAIEHSGTWDAVTKSLGVANISQNRTTIRRHADKLGITTDHLDPMEEAPRPEPAHLQHLREAALTIAASWFTLRGFAPSIPLDTRPYDLLVDMRGPVHRVQVKTCMAGSGDVTIAYRLAGTTKGALVPYRASDVDQFFILDGDLAIYLIPIAAVEGRLRISLRKYRRYCVGSARSLIE
ncbi:group I intron-associated PD-(D/E)XK endonuclease [Nonomuraea basaltis]|uniref:group I intron-associated PD-(D/E)XK endonuclease n=1 Tax=Nonomuraea basaltis TaxID=2495887 RepID=UPI00110C5DAB|nr:group I intron-associated PD-(D/E)XK endonuclease [Nonomuraea basaltis]TMR96912.1 hypothetical protein EJK15_20965 [Nonomuraea basaltis]